MLVELSVKLMVIVHVKSMSLEKIAMSAYQEHGICYRPMNWVVKVSIFKLLHSWRNYLLTLKVWLNFNFLKQIPTFSQHIETLIL